MQVFQPILPLESVEISIKKGGSSNSHPEQDWSGEVEGGVEAGGARVELNKTKPCSSIFLCKFQLRMILKQEIIDSKPENSDFFSPSKFCKTEATINHCEEETDCC